ncbi:MAG TPA: glucan 1,4-alpha-glucosidase, partial [Bacteroidetes bacterium]|nr:glucan 1,4-alpha-glucosidase [Bacteroidota bacterium]
DEARAKHHEFVRNGRREIFQGLTFWSPNVNLFRDPRWGRGMETYGEDPYLTGTLAVAFVKGLQGEDPDYLKTVATPKHYVVHSGPEPERHRFDAVVDEHDLRETYLPAFELSVKRGQAESVMCAYNRTLHEACCASRRLLQQILREEWGFRGYIVSDCGAIDDIWRGHKLVGSEVEAAARALLAGTDLECGERAYLALAEAVRQGLIQEQDVDTALRRVFTARFRLGMFDPPERVRYAHTPFWVVNCPEHRALALEAAHKSIVLLKNDGLLPLDKAVQRVAVLGPNADDELVLVGNYEGTPARSWTLLDGLREKLSDTAKVRFALGPDLAEGMPGFERVPAYALRVEPSPEAEPGLKATYFDNRNFEGEPVLQRVEPELRFASTVNPPLPDFRNKPFSARWEGFLLAPETGDYTIGAYGFKSFRVVLDGREIVRSDEHHKRKVVYERVRLGKGRPVPFLVEFRSAEANTQHRADLQLVWSRPESTRVREALALAEWAEVVILALGLSPRLEGEEMPVDIPGFRGGDRLDIRLPEPQQRFLEQVVERCPKTVLVLFNGSALAVEWAAEHVPAIVEAWYPGEAGGKAVANVLFGDVNPGGRLPVTFYRSIEDLPPFEDYRMENRTYRYFRGEPLYPFGFGLSYTRFAYRNLELPEQIRAGKAARVAVEVENAGDRAGEEVVQLDVTDREASSRVPIRSLQGYR